MDIEYNDQQTLADLNTRLHIHSDFLYDYRLRLRKLNRRYKTCKRKRKSITRLLIKEVKVEISSTEVLINGLLNEIKLEELLNNE